MPRDYTPSLHQAKDLAATLQSSVKNFNHYNLVFKGPIIDRQAESSGGWRQDEIQGFRKWIENLNHHQAGLDAMIALGVPPKEDPLPNIQGFVTFWKQVLLARKPIAALRTSIKGKGKEEAFVDIIARGGEEWIRIYSKKISQLLAEFREQDSYLNSDSESDYDVDDSQPSSSARTKPLEPLTNSILATANCLLSVADEAERIPGAPTPKITIRLSRITEHPEGGYEDPRIEETFNILRGKGINLLFGDLSEIELQTLIESSAIDSVPDLQPSLKINMDPTALMGLCSDLLHYPLPLDEKGAKERYLRPKEFLLTHGEWNGDGNGRNDTDNEDELAGQSQNSRELVRGTLEEMEYPLIGEIRDTLTKALAERSNRRAEVGNVEKVEFWATKEAVQFVKETISTDEVIGDGMEQRRMRRMLGIESGNFWEGSRWEGQEGVLGDMKIKVFEDQLPRVIRRGVGKASAEQGKSDDRRDPFCRDSMSSFHLSMRAITSVFLDEWYTLTSTDRRSPPDEPFIDSINNKSLPLPNFLHPKRLPTPKTAILTLPFIVVSLHSYHRGAAEGMTTLSMGNVVFRDLFAQIRWRIRGWVQGNYELEREDGVEKVNAAAWVLPYRTLGEGKRVKFEKGDYSYPR